MVKLVQEAEVLPHPAEDLSSDDDLLSWILVDQLGCLPNTKLGVHPQQVKFVGPPFKTSDVLSIVQETVINTNLPEAMRRFMDFHLIKAHSDAKQTPKQKERFVQHLRRYLLPLLPTSRIEIYTTNRYTAVTGHTELAVYATRPLPHGTVLQELQGSVVPLPDAWRAEMDLGDEFALEAAGQEGDTDEEEEDEDEARTNEGRTTEDGLEDGSETPSRRGGRRKKESRGARRSDRTKRRDFSIVWSGLKRCYQLFLGPARFLNHDCNPNVELLRQGKYVTFRVIRPIRIGDEVMTFYGENYFGKDNVECLCLSCEQAGRNGFAPKASGTDPRSRSRSQSMMRAGSPPSRRTAGPSALRTALNGLRDESPSASTENDVEAGPSGSQVDGDDPSTPRKPRSRATAVAESINGVDSPSTESIRSEPESPSDDPPKRERYHRRAARNAQHFSFLKRPKKQVVQEPQYDLPVDDEDEDCVRCATCAKAMHERIWYNNKYFDHCARCVRHALIFDLPWPAHRTMDVLDYPPSHLIPAGYIPPRVSSIALPSLDKHRKKHVEPAPVSPQGETHAERRARKFRQECAMEDLRIEQLREAMWTAQDTAETQAKAAAQAKIDAKEKKAEEKRLKDQNKIKGSGVWSRYEYIDEAELERRRLARMAVTTGTRRGGRFKPPESDEEESEGQKEEEMKNEDQEGAAEGAEDREEEPIVSSNQANRSTQSKTDRRPKSVKQKEAGALADSQSDSPITPVADTIQPKNEPGSSSRSTRVRDMPHVDLFSDAESYDSGEIECIDGPTKQLIAQATKVTKKQRGDLSDDSDIIEVDATPSKLTKGSPKTNKSKPNGSSVKSGIAKPVPAVARPDGSASPTKRGRGRPPGTGKKQRAAVLHAARFKPNPNAPTSASPAGPSRISKSRPEPKSKATIDTDDDLSDSHFPVITARRPSTSRSKVNGDKSKNSNFLLDIEDKIEQLTNGSPDYQWMIESINQEGRLAWKALQERTGKSPFPPERVLREFVDREHGEFLRQLVCVQKDRDISDHRPLPGQRPLVNHAELKHWYPSRMSTPTTENASTVALDRPYNVVGGLEVVGYTVDTYACGQDEPKEMDGPWRNGHYRMIASRSVPSNTAESNLTTTLDPVKRHLVQANGSGNGKGKGRASTHPSPPKKASTSQPPSKTVGKSPSSRAGGVTAPSPRPSTSTPNGQSASKSISNPPETPSTKKMPFTTSSSLKIKLANAKPASTDKLAAIADKYKQGGSPQVKPPGSTTATSTTLPTGSIVNGHAHRTGPVNGNSPNAVGTSGLSGPAVPASTSLITDRTPATTQNKVNGASTASPLASSAVTGSAAVKKPSLAGSPDSVRDNKRKLEDSLSPARKRPMSVIGAQT